ncbi:MAG TPA: cyclopropane-fatty-acyl-phospholipid synthase family protein [Burkholderiales bacterium]|nr:cyclopropane-fatty-acyl-phospholipid synthase family protein [Burkholderiales bacterium]
MRKVAAWIGSRTAICVRFEFADGSSSQNRDGPPVVTVRFRSPRAHWRTALFGHIGLLESYFAGDLDIDGSIPAAFRVASESGFDMGTLRNPLIGIRNRWHEFRFSNRSIAQARSNARFHYGLGAEFYRLWLDAPLMMYTCAYWREGTRTVEEAQANKVEHVCRKLRLQPGEEVIDVGSGFGGFMFHAVERHGVRGTALNTTTEQCDWVRDEVARRGLADRIAVREADFREVDRQYDKVVSIGVLEHAGRDQLREVVRAHADFLKPGGLGMLHFIGHVGVRDTEFFIRRHIFPGGWIPSLAETIVAMEDAGLEVVDIENLRRHYAPTLDAWAERFDRNWERIHALDPKRFDERFRRAWRTYLYGCAEMFRSPRGRTHLFQIVYSKGNITRMSYPMSRAFLYDEGRLAAAVHETPVPATA